MAAVPRDTRRRPLGEGFDLAELQARPSVERCSVSVLAGTVARGMQICRRGCEI